MADDATDDPLLVDFQYWLLGLVLLFVIVAVGSVSATALQDAGVPYGGEIGGIGGAVLTFLAISYWYYGR